MAFAYKKLKEIAQLSDSAAAVITNAASKTTYVRLIILHNTNTSSETVELYNVPNNAEAVGTAAAANQFYKDNLSPDETVTMEFPAPGIVLTDTNDTIQGKTTTASKVSFQAYGGDE